MGTNDKLALEGIMGLKTRICFVSLLVLTGVVSGSCVSDEKYRMKVQESDKLSSELKALKAERNDLEKERRDLRVKILSFEEGMTRLKEENETLRSKAQALEVEKKEEILGVRAMYENLVEDMESEIKKGKITITQLKGKLKVNMVDEILFDSGRTTIKPQGIQVLDRVGKVLLNVKDQTIRIEGHTDNVPIGPELAKMYPTNWELSAARATAVARYLQEKIGVHPSLLSATGQGQYRPIASNETVQGQARNRRIEIVLVPKEIAPPSRK